MQIGTKIAETTALKNLVIAKSAQRFPEKPMASAEISLKQRLSRQNYGYLFGMSFTKDQWEKSELLRQKLSELSQSTLLGKPAPRGKEQPGMLSGFWELNGDITFREKIRTNKFGFKPSASDWIPLERDGVYYNKPFFAVGPKAKTDPVWVSYGSLRFDQAQNELLFDADHQTLVVIWKANLPYIDSSSGVELGLR